ncbi:MAG TPA: hypothetical protein VLD19_06685, partial [Chitinophagaceae bacterium]|nr:hypothetical protein [Chitinophagaceae bacterium]
RLGSPQKQGGDAISYGLDLNYYRRIYKDIFGRLGAGYFMQNFRIARPFNFTSPVNLLYSTESYNYDNTRFVIGVGYEKKVEKKSVLKGYINFNGFNTFRQKYIVNKQYKTWQVNHESFALGSMVDLELGYDRSISERFSIGLDLLCPVYVHWNKDPMFISSSYSNEEQRVASNKFSLGAAISCSYHF